MIDNGYIILMKSRNVCKNVKESQSFCVLYVETSSRVLYFFAVTTGRKAMTIVLSFMFFAKPFTFQWVLPTFDFDCFSSSLEFDWSTLLFVYNKETLDFFSPWPWLSCPQSISRPWLLQCSLPHPSHLLTLKWLWLCFPLYLCVYTHSKTQN